MNAESYGKFTGMKDTSTRGETPRALAFKGVRVSRENGATLSLRRFVCIKGLLYE